MGRRFWNQLSGWGHTKKMDRVQTFLQITEEECKLKENMGALKRPHLEMWTKTLGSETGGDSRQELSSWEV